MNVSAREWFASIVCVSVYVCMYVRMNVCMYVWCACVCVYARASVRENTWSTYPCEKRVQKWEEMEKDRESKKGRKSVVTSSRGTRDAKGEKERDFLNDWYGAILCKAVCKWKMKKKRKKRMKGNQREEK